ncbi:hypothetical protein SprV_0200941800 [Sparganum proliferum]
MEGADETEENETESTKIEDFSPLENAENDDLSGVAKEANEDVKIRRESQVEKKAGESGIDEISVTRVNSEPTRPYEGKRHSEEDAAIIIQRAYRNRASLLQRRSKSEAPQDNEILSHQSSVERFSFRLTRSFPSDEETGTASHEPSIDLSSSQVLQGSMEDEDKKTPSREHSRDSDSNILSRKPSTTLGSNILSREPSTTLSNNIRSREPSAPLDELMPGGAPSRASSIKALSRDPSAEVSKPMSSGARSSASGSTRFSRKTSAISGGSTPSRKPSATLDTIIPGGAPSRASGSHLSSREPSATPSKVMSGSAHTRAPSASLGSPTPMEAVGRMNTDELRGLAEEEAAVIIQRAYRAHSSIHSTDYTPKPSISGPSQEKEVTSRKASAEPKDEIKSRKSSAKSTNEITSRKVSAESKSSPIPDPIPGVEDDEVQEMETSRKSSAGVLDTPDSDKSREAMGNPPESPDEDELTEVPANYGLGGDDIKLDDEKEETAEAPEETDNDFVEGSLAQNEGPEKDDTVTLFPEKSLNEVPDGETAEVESEHRTTATSDVQ